MINERWLFEWEGFIRVGKNDIAFDIGANDGTWTTTLQHWYTKVVSVEPDQRCLPPRGHVYDRRAVAAAEGEVEMYLRECSLQNSTSAFHAVGSNGLPVHVVEKRNVPATTLDFLAQKYGEPDFIKIDIEGGEIDALKGATMPCFRRCRWIIELHDTRLEVCQGLSRLGYERVTIMPHPDKEAGKGHEWALVLPNDYGVTR
jgi:FkbM family methyltransferase